MLTAATAALYVGRCACDADSEWAAGFAPVGAAARSALRSMSFAAIMGLPRCAAGLVRALLLPHVSAVEIDDGNVNFSFRLACHGGRALFLKQATNFIKWQPQMALEAERMAREVRYLGKCECPHSI